MSTLSFFIKIMPPNLSQLLFPSHFWVIQVHTLTRLGLYRQPVFFSIDFVMFVNQAPIRKSGQFFFFLCIVFLFYLSIFHDNNSRYFLTPFRVRDTNYGHILNTHVTRKQFTFDFKCRYFFTTSLTDKGMITIWSTHSEKKV